MNETTTRVYAIPSELRELADAIERLEEGDTNCYVTSASVAIGEMDEPVLVRRPDPGDMLAAVLVAGETP